MRVYAEACAQALADDHACQLYPKRFGHSFSFLTLVEIKLAILKVAAVNGSCQDAVNGFCHFAFISK